MTLARLVLTLGRNDVRLILRDRMLVMLLGMAALMGLAARFALPALDASLAAGGVLPSDTVELRFADTYPVWTVFIGLWQASLLPGTAFGFMLLDEQEDGTLIAMRVTPVPMARYVGYRVAQPALLALMFGLALPPLIGHAPIAAWQLIPIALGASLTAPLAMLLLASFANDKVQGLAYTKFGGVAGLTILFGWFAPEPWQWGLGLFPPFLVAKSYWMAHAGHGLWWAPLLVAIVTQLALLRWLLGRFARL